MKKDYNQFTKSDIPLDASLSPSSRRTTSAKTTTKPKINAIGAKAKQQASTQKKSVDKKPKEANKADDLKTKRAKDLADLSKLNEENIRSHSFRSKRNQVIIVLLALMLAIAIAFIVIYFTATKADNNAFLYVHGTDVDAVYVVDGDELSEFRVPANISGECILNINVAIKINSPGNYYVRFVINCYNNGELLNNVAVYEPNITSTGFTFKDGAYHSRSTVTGGQTIALCQGVALNAYDVDVDDDNFKLEIHTYLVRA